MFLGLTRQKRLNYLRIDFPCVGRFGFLCLQKWVKGNTPFLPKLKLTSFDSKTKNILVLPVNIYFERLL